jgi:hypothetical protein
LPEDLTGARTLAELAMTIKTDFSIIAKPSLLFLSSGSLRSKVPAHGYRMLVIKNYLHNSWQTIVLPCGVVALVNFKF